mmetsp:Transcript_91218/g.185691  ORF Transcript_91218/g.185691 Transcript_91218/m.185691 type:complete len:144 (-) Transcript_91218:61-492(-)
MSMSENRRRHCDEWKMQASATPFVFRFLPKRDHWIWKQTVLANETHLSVVFHWYWMRSMPKTGETFTKGQVRICQVRLMRLINSINNRECNLITNRKGSRIHQLVAVIHEVMNVNEEKLNRLHHAHTRGNMHLPLFTKCSGRS